VCFIASSFESVRLTQVDNTDASYLTIPLSLTILTIYNNTIEKLDKPALTMLASMVMYVQQLFVGWQVTCLLQRINNGVISGASVNDSSITASVNDVSNVAASVGGEGIATQNVAVIQGRNIDHTDVTVNAGSILNAAAAVAGAATAEQQVAVITGNAVSNSSIKVTARTVTNVSAGLASKAAASQTVGVIDGGDIQNVQLNVNVGSVLNASAGYWQVNCQKVTIPK
jgi:hypothetical protein